MNERPIQFRLWRLFAATACFATAFGLVRFTIAEVEQYGGGGFPTLCIFAAIMCVAAGTGMLFNKACEFMLGVACIILRIFGGI